MSHQRVKFLTKNGVGCVQSNPKNLFDFQMTSKEKLIEQPTPMKIGMVQVVQFNEEQSNEEICRQISQQVLYTIDKAPSKYDEVIINPQFLNQKIKIG